MRVGVAQITELRTVLLGVRVCVRQISELCTILCLFIGVLGRSDYYGHYAPICTILLGARVGVGHVTELRIALWVRVDVAQITKLRTVLLGVRVGVGQTIEIHTVLLEVTVGVGRHWRWCGDASRLPKHKHKNSGRQRSRHISKHGASGD